jgi:plasmid maintenance system antidote protein VapI
MKTDILSKLLDRSGLTRDEVAESMGITRMQLYRLLTNPRRMRVEQMIRLAVLLKKSPRYVISLIGKV